MTSLKAAIIWEGIRQKLFGIRDKEGVGDAVEVKED